MKYTAFIILALITVNPVFKMYPEVRPNLKDQGYGWMINDLERHAHAGNPMRNESDPGNWVHELTHQVNSDIRVATRAHDNAFYVMKGRYVIFVEPNVTLKQVAKMVPEKDRGPIYHSYLVEQQRGWNREPLYVLDEATAYANGLQYHVTTHTKDQSRLDYANEFLAYTEALIRTIEKYDPDYKQLTELREYVEWNKRRVKTLTVEYNGGEPIPEPNDYNFYGGVK